MLTYCDRCFGLVQPDDGTTIHIEAKGIKHSFTYHNRNGSDCLAHKIRELKIWYQEEKKHEAVPEVPEASS
jgi:hypothetical protein